MVASVVIPTKLKDPQAKLDYGFDWSSSDWLDSGEVISASSWTVPSGITKDAESFSDTLTTIWLTGGTVDTTYLLVNHITTDAGREDDRSVNIVVVNR